MKIIIEHGKTKRQILGPYNLCTLDNISFKLLFKALVRGIVNEDQRKNIQRAIAEAGELEFTMGWVSIYSEQEMIPNSPPGPWE